MALEKDSEQVTVRKEKLKAWREQLGGTAYRNGFKPSALAAPLHHQYDGHEGPALEAENVRVSIAGRILMVRDFGKAAFLRIKDRSGLMQLFVQRNKLGDAGFEAYRKLDIGDIVFAEGVLFKTKTNELSVSCDRLELVTKALRPLPEKFHGIEDVEIKYRQRYLDLITSGTGDASEKSSLETFRKRSKIIESLRRFFLEHDFLEVETPMMHPIAGGATARPFTTHHNALDMKLYMRIAPELYLKRLVVGGLERVFEINRNFRNEGISIKHNPEFTMVEFYQAYATYEDLMDFSEKLFQRIADDVLGSRTLTYQGTEIRLDGQWERIRVEDAIAKYTDFVQEMGSAAKLRDREALLAYGKRKNLPMKPKDSTGGLMMVIFDELVEAQLIQPTFVTHYPLDVSPLSRQSDTDPWVVDRFELYIYGREMANAFSELNDPEDQHARFLAQVADKNAGNDEACDMDEDYVQALEYGMPPTAGQGIGIDRLTMLFTDSASIRDVILFPLMRPQGHAPAAGKSRPT